MATALNDLADRRDTVTAIILICETRRSKWCSVAFTIHIHILSRSRSSLSPTMHAKLALIVVIFAISAALISAVPIGQHQLHEHEFEAAIPSDSEVFEDLDYDVSQLSENELEESAAVTPTHISTADFGKTVLASLEANMLKLTASMDALKSASDKAAVSAAAFKVLFDSAKDDTATKKASMDGAIQASAVASKLCSDNHDARLAAEAVRTQAINTAKDTSAIDKELELIAHLKKKLVEVLKHPLFDIVTSAAKSTHLHYFVTPTVDQHQKSATNRKFANIRTLENQFYAGCSSCCGQPAP
jgi:hypothetical protein